MRNARSLLVFWVTFTLGCVVQVSANTARLKPVELHCDGMGDPLGVDSNPPRLSWKLEGDDTRGARQTAWQIIVSSSREILASGRGDIWDSGRIESAEQLHLSYAGRPLRSSEQVFWQVRIWDGAGTVSPWSEVATWTMGLLAAEDWSARWITDPTLLQWQRPNIGYSSETTTNAKTVKWLVLDLGKSRQLETIRLHALTHTVSERLGFPHFFKVETADDPAFQNATIIADYTKEKYPEEWTSLITLPAKQVSARYVRITGPQLSITEGQARLAFSQIEIISNGKNIAPGAKVTASDSFETAPWSASAVVDGLGVPGANPHANSTLLLRRDFAVRPPLRRALLHVSGLGHYELTVNGRQVSTDVLKPGWTKYEKTNLYDTYDLTNLLNAGSNTIGLMLAGGMYNVQAGQERYVKFVSAFRPLMAIAQLQLEYPGEPPESVVTNAQWRVSSGPITYANVFGGEDFDARLMPDGWDRPGFDDSAWTPAVIRAGPGGALRGASHAAPPMREQSTLVPVSVRELRPGVKVYDLGQNAALIPRLKVLGSAGSTVKIIPAELLKPDGSVDRGSCGGGDAAWNYVLSGGKEGEAWFPKFFYHGCRYLQVELTAPAGKPLPEIISLEGVVVHSSSPAAGDFACSSELFNRIHTLVRWAQRSNLAHVITDCPHREKLGWLEQYHLNGPALRYEFDLGRLFAKTFGDMVDAQEPNGLVPSIAPDYVIFNDGFRDSPEWGSALILSAWQQYVWTGDDTPIRRHYDAMRHYLTYLDGKASDHLLNHGLGDWYDIGPKPPGRSQLTPIALTATALYYECTVAVAHFAERLDRNEDAHELTARASEIKTAFNRKFLNGEKASYASGSQTAQALPLVLGLVPDAKRAGVLTTLVRDVQSRGNAVTAGDVGYRYLLRALAEGGRSDVIYAMNAQSEKPGYGYQLAHGATSLTEAWNANPSSSQNHFMLGQIMEWFYHDLVGLAPDPAAPGFANVIIQPQPVAGIDWARASYESPRGKIAVEWHRMDEKFTLKIDLPPNTSATVILPDSMRGPILESGLPVAKNPAITPLGETVGVPNRYNITSGHFEFQAQEIPRG